MRLNKESKPNEGKSPMSAPERKHNLSNKIPNGFSDLLTQLESKTKANHSSSHERNPYLFTSNSVEIKWEKKRKHKQFIEIKNQEQ